MDSFGQMPSMASNVFSAYASISTSMMLFRSMANDIIPESIKNFFITTFTHIFKNLFGRFFSKLSSTMTIIIDDQTGMLSNEIYDATEIYLRTIINPNADRLKANKTTKQKNITVCMEKEEKVEDFYNGIKLTWQFVLIEPEEKKRYSEEKRFFELSFDKLAKETVLTEYLPFVIKRAKEIKESEKTVKLYTRDCPYYNDDDDNEGGYGGGGIWGGVPFDHPVTFDKLAMDVKMKKSVIEDLDRFVRRRDYYKRVGKAWKRGYLLYGPPGTGKSSLIAAMANHLRFNIYDLELTSVYSNEELRRILLCTTNRSIIVIEDVDCSVQMHDREDDEDEGSNSKLTLSGMLNFIDGLWSTCGDERIIVFTTNHKEKLDPALLRPGRMDMHIHMGYCSPEGFDVLAMNYLELDDHRLFPEIKGLILEVEVTPAEIAEHLMRNEDVDLALEGVIGLLKQKKDEMAVEDTVGEIEVEEKREGKFRKVLRNLSKFGSRKSMSRVSE